MTANRRQFTRPARICATDAALAEIPEMPMFAPAPPPASSRRGGSPAAECSQYQADQPTDDSDEEAPRRHRGGRRPGFIGRRLCLLRPLGRRSRYPVGHEALNELFLELDHVRDVPCDGGALRLDRDLDVDERDRSFSEGEDLVAPDLEALTTRCASWQKASGRRPPPCHGPVRRHADSGAISTSGCVTSSRPSTSRLHSMPRRRIRSARRSLRPLKQASVGCGRKRM